jgi:flagellar hook-associated protein 3 FlgL
MDRVTTSGMYNGVLANLMSAQNQVNTAVAQTSSGMKATDLKGFGANAETLTAAQNVLATTTGYLNNTQNTASQLSMQDQALTQLGSDVTSASQAVTAAIGSGSGATLMQSLQGYFSDAVGQLNVQYNGQYLFSGGQVNTQPVTATSLSDLTSAPSVASLFQNGQEVGSTKLDGTTSIQTGFLASNLGTPLFNALQAIQAYNDGPNGPFGSTLTAAQATFLQSQVATLNSVADGVTTAQGQNGIAQNQVTAAQTGLASQQTTLQGMIGDIANANLAQVAANLQQAQLAVQATAQVFASLKSTSLASLLPIA